MNNALKNAINTIMESILMVIQNQMDPAILKQHLPVPDNQQHLKMFLNKRLKGNWQLLFAKP